MRGFVLQYEHPEHDGEVGALLDYMRECGISIDPNEKLEAKESIYESWHQGFVEHTRRGGIIHA